LLSVLVDLARGALQAVMSQTLDQSNLFPHKWKTVKAYLENFLLEGGYGDIIDVALDRGVLRLGLLIMHHFYVVISSRHLCPAYCAQLFVDLIRAFDAFGERNFGD
jgi:hypothetical protein